jgi:hypothetical protein
MPATMSELRTALEGMMRLYESKWGDEPPELIVARAALAAAPPEPPSAAFAAEMFAQMFHEAYERLAPQFGYETRRESAKPWIEVPEQNRNLMIATCADVLAHFKAAPPEPPSDNRLEAATPTKAGE